MSRRVRRSGYRSSVRNPPKPVSKAAPPAPAPAGGDSLLGRMGVGVVEAVTWGFGSSIGHRVGDFILGPRTIYYEQKVAEQASTPNSSRASDACSSHNLAFQDCLNSNSADVGKCQFYMDMLAECRRGSTSTLTA
ncbi:hypothetical protein ACHQM5_016315 [Ranunculus cassubicifolius]